MKYQLIFGLAVLFVVAVSSEETTKEESETCVPGEDFKVGCNTCKCAESGKKADSPCTLKACIDDPAIPTTPTETEATKCEPGTTYQVDCNTCTCPENGSKVGAACTAIACDPKPEGA